MFGPPAIGPRSVESMPQEGEHDRRKQQVDVSTTAAGRRGRTSLGMRVAIMAELLIRLYGVATDEETALLDSLAIRAGIKWQCACGWHNAERVLYCEDCREPRPSRR